MVSKSILKEIENHINFVSTTSNESDKFIQMDNHSCRYMGTFYKTAEIYLDPFLRGNVIKY